MISCAFNRAVGAAVWFPPTLGLRHGFAFGCADGSVHIYTSDKITICHDPAILLECANLIIIAQLQYSYFIQDILHDGPIMALKCDPQFC